MRRWNTPRRNGLIAVAVCPFVKKYVESHPEVVEQAMETAALMLGTD